MATKAKGTAAKTAKKIAQGGRPSAQNRKRWLGEGKQVQKELLKRLTVRRSVQKGDLPEFYADARAGLSPTDTAQRLHILPDVVEETIRKGHQQMEDYRRHKKTTITLPMRLVMALGKARVNLKEELLTNARESNTWRAWLEAYEIHFGEDDHGQDEDSGGGKWTPADLEVPDDTD